MAELRRALHRPVVRGPPRLALLLEPPEAPAPFDIVERCEQHLGRHSIEFRAMTIIAGPSTVSIRQLCHERYRWHRSRPSLYRQARRGARLMAQWLNADRIAPLQYADPAHP